MSYTHVIRCSPSRVKPLRNSPSMIMHDSVEIYEFWCPVISRRRSDGPGARPDMYQAIRLKFGKVSYLSFEAASNTYLSGEIVFRRGIRVAIVATTPVTPPHSINNEVDISVWYIEVGQLP
jgi:hypothetical protein